MNEDNGTWGVVAARVVPTGYEFFKHFPEHLWVDCYFNVNRCGFGYCEVVAFKEFQDFGKCGVGDMDMASRWSYLPCISKEATIQKGDFATEFNCCG